MRAKKCTWRKFLQRISPEQLDEVDEARKQILVRMADGFAEPMTRSEIVRESLRFMVDGLRSGSYVPRSERPQEREIYRVKGENR